MRNARVALEEWIASSGDELCAGLGVNKEFRR